MAGDKAVQASGDVCEEIGDPGGPAKEPASNRARFRLGMLYCDMPCLDRLVLIIGIVTAAMYGTTGPVFAVMMAEAVSQASSLPPDQVFQAMTNVAQLVLVLCGSGFVLSFIWITCLLWFAARQTARLRMKYFGSVLTRDISWFDQNQPAALPAKMVTESRKIHEAIGTKTGDVVMILTQFIAGLIFAFARGWELALVMCGTIPIVLGISNFTTYRLKLLMKDQGDCVARAGAVTEESLLAIRTVSAFGGEDREVARLERALVGARHAGIQTQSHLGITFGAFALFFCGAFAMALGYGSHCVIATNRYTQADFTVVFVSVLVGLSALSNLQGPVDAFLQAMGAALSMYSVINAQPEIEPVKEGGKEQPLGALTIETVEFRGVCFSYPSRPEAPILRGLTLRISRGQKVALVGGSGSGKSTVVQLVERFYDPCVGGVFVNGMPLPRIPVRSWRRLLGLVGQEPVLFQCSVLDNIRGGSPEVTNEQCLEAARQAEAFDFVSALPLGFRTLAGVGGSQLSGGQKQRIAIARALARSPQLLILDEATSALDSTSEKQVQATLDQLQSAACRGLTTITVAHRLSTIVNSDEILVFKDGRVAERGSHTELMKARGEYVSLARAQSMPQTDDSGDECGNAQDDPDNYDVPSTPLRAEATIHTSLPSPVHGALPAPATPPGSISRLVGLSKPEWAIYPVALLSALLSGAQFPLLGLCFSHAFTGLSLQPVKDMLARTDKYSLSLVMLGITVSLGEFGKHSLFGYMQQALILRLQKMTFASIVRQEMGFFDDPSTGIGGLSTALARMTTDVSLMLGISFGNMVQSLFAALAGIAVGFFGSVKLTLVLLAMLPLAAASTVIVARILTDPFYSEANALADSLTASAALNIRTLRASNAEAHMQNLFSQAVTAASALEARSAPRKALAVAVNAVVSYMVYLFGMWYGGKLITAKGVDPQGVYQALLCVTMGFGGAGLAAAYGPAVRHGRLSAAVLFSIIDREPRIDVRAPSGLHQSLGDGTIHLRDVSFCFPHRKEVLVLKRISFSVARGQTVALVGPSGSGKSTLIQLLLRFYDPAQGSIQVGGTDLRCLDLAWWRRQLGLVSQEPVLFDMSLEDNVKYGFPEATRAEVEAAALLANMDYALSGTVAWGDSLGLRGERLSGGQKQRCAIARAVVRSPEVLLLDEATSALDSASEHAVQMALDDARKGRTTFTVAHRLSTIRDSDLILVVSSSRILERGTHDELLAMQGWYAKTAARL